MLNLFKCVHLRKTCSNTIFLIEKRSELSTLPSVSCTPTIKPRYKERASGFFGNNSNQHVNVSRELEDRLNAEVERLNCSQEPIFKEKIESITQAFWRNGFHSRKLFESIVKLFKHELLDCEPKERVRLMERLLLHIDEPDVYHYNALISLHLDNDTDFTRNKFLNDLCVNNNIKSNEETQRLIFKYLCNKCMIQEAIKILSQIPKSEELYADLMVAYGKARKFQDAFHVRKSMKDKKVPTMSYTYTALMCLCAMQNDVESIKYIHNKCAKSYTHIGNIDANKVLYTLVSCGYSSSIPEVLNIFNKEADHKNIFLFILRLLTKGKEKLAIEIWEKHCVKILNANSNYNAYQYIFFRRLYRNTLNLKKTHSDTMRNYKKYNVLLEYQLLEGFNKDGDIVKYRSYIDILRNENTYPLKALHFWPLFANCVKDMDIYDMFCIIDYMINQCGIQPCFYTLKDFVLPYMVNNNYFINILKSLQVQEITLNNAIVYLHLRLKRVRKSYQHLLFNDSIYDKSLLSRVLLRAVVFTQDVSTFVKIAPLLKNVNVCAEIHNSKDEDTIPPVSMDEYVLEFLKYFPREKQLLGKLEQQLKTSNIPLSSETVVIFREIQTPKWNKSMSLQSFPNHNKVGTQYM